MPPQTQTQGTMTTVFSIGQSRPMSQHLPISPLADTQKPHAFRSLFCTEQQQVYTPITADLSLWPRLWVQRVRVLRLGSVVDRMHFQGDKHGGCRRCRNHSAVSQIKPRQTLQIVLGIVIAPTKVFYLRISEHVRTVT